MYGRFTLLAGHRRNVSLSTPRSCAKTGSARHSACGSSGRAGQSVRRGPLLCHNTRNSPSSRAVLNLMTASRQRGITFAERNPREYRLNENGNLNAFLTQVRGEAFREHGGFYNRDEVAFLLIFCVRVQEEIGRAHV